MPDKRIRRKHPVKLRLFHGGLVFDVFPSVDGYGASIATRRSRVDISRSHARKIRDWLNHFIEFSAENDRE